MREILFRGKRVANGKWVKGFAFEQHSPTEKEQWYIRSYETDYNVDPIQSDSTQAKKIKTE